MAFGLLLAQLAFSPLMGTRVGARVGFAGSRSLTSMSVTDEINKLISSNDVVVFSKSYCPYCTKTKNLFKEMDVEVKILELDQMDDGDEYQEELLAMTKQKTVPNVFLKGEHMGGNDDVQKAKDALQLWRPISLGSAPVAPTIEPISSSRVYFPKPILDEALHPSVVLNARGRVDPSGDGRYVLTYSPGRQAGPRGARGALRSGRVLSW
jgi:glutaredoxin 3